MFFTTTITIPQKPSQRIIYTKTIRSFSPSQMTPPPVGSAPDNWEELIKANIKYAAEILAAIASIWVALYACCCRKKGQKENSTEQENAADGERFAAADAVIPVAEPENAAADAVIPVAEPGNAQAEAGNAAAEAVIEIPRQATEMESQDNNRFARENQE